jgi:hypothetical protein
LDAESQATAEVRFGDINRFNPGAMLTNLVDYPAMAFIV